MDALELVSVVKRLHEGECPKCGNKLNYLSDEISTGILEKNGMAATSNIMKESHVVFCKTCGYHKLAVQIGLKLIPIDRICESDPNWDNKYLEQNVLVYGEEGKNPFYKKDKE